MRGVESEIDIEFYWFSKNHKDTITYPRNCNAGDWFFHNSGVDLAFDSYVSTFSVPNAIIRQSVLK